MKQWILVLLLATVLLVACHNAEDSGESRTETAILTLPHLETADLNGDKLRVVATTSIIGDIVAQVGGEEIDLKVLINVGQDSHSYEPGAQDLTAVADAHVIFINGWRLEEGLLDNLTNVSDTAVLVPVSAGITPLFFTAENGAKQSDPHVWLDPQNVQQWVKNIEQVLTALDPTHAPLYEANARVYLQELDVLLDYMDAQMATIPLARRKLVTNHDALGYLAARYDFTLIGTILPGGSTLAEPSASDLTQLAQAMQAADTCTIFTETTANIELAQAIAAELDNCEEVQILSLYIEAVTQDSEADSYINMMKTDIDLLVKGL